MVVQHSQQVVSNPTYTIVQLSLRLAEKLIQTSKLLRYMRKFIKDKLSIIIPTYNEENIVILLSEIIEEMKDRDYKIQLMMAQQIIPLTIFLKNLIKMKEQN